MNNKTGSCHCGGVKFSVDLPNGLNSLSRCNCSMCARRGAIMQVVPLNAFKVIAGEDYLSLYEFNTHTAKHYFCKTCGIYTHHQMRSHPDHYSINVACLDGVNIADLGEVPTTDGINHSKDR